MKTPLETLYDELFGRAEAIIKEGQEHMPLIIAFQQEGDEYVLKGLGQALMSDDDEKNLTAHIIHKLVERMPPAGLVVFISEAWMKILAPGEEIPADGHVDPKSAGTSECVLFHFYGKEFESMASCAVDHKARVLHKGPITKGADGGRFAVHGPRTIN